ncbi:hypothetical protein [Oceanisphaera pacifica]|uniref:Host cell division inhibitor Icd-like protein n=1 Tax=Oceanisphaera pacifica TaxID=2818389 RepID=A0ABS3NCH5_9GAMM|nr:hypothetical protein [Oceanisphaera pacifica]MBO1518245.1 hypothetical protein [Oceanisphaera pacifica]
MKHLINGRNAQGIGLSKNSVSHSFGSIPREFSSLRMTRLIQADIEASPSSFKAFMMPCSKSGSTRKFICLLPLAFMTVDTCCTPAYYYLVKQVYDTSKAKTTKPDSAVTLIGLLTTNVKRLTTMAVNKFTFVIAQGKQRIAAIQKIRFITVLASTEQEARAIAGASSLVFVSRYPVMGVAA